MQQSPPPHITILMPLYNGVEYIEAAIKSVIAQTVTASLWELVIGVNGHPPNSPVYHKVRKFVHSAPTHFRAQIHVVDFGAASMPPRGKAATLNLMVTQYTHPMSQWIALLDADDIWEPDKLRLQLPHTYPCMRQLEDGRRVKCAPVDVIGTRCQYINARGDLLGTVPPIPTGAFGQETDFLKANPVINSSALIRRELAHWDEKWEGCEDYVLWLQLWRAGYKFYNCPECAVLHRIYPTSSFNGSAVQKVRLDALRAVFQRDGVALT